MALEAINSPCSSSAGPPAVDRHQWTKGIQAKRPRLDFPTPPRPSEDDQYLALCLLMLARGGKRGSNTTTVRSVTDRHPSPPTMAASSSYPCTVCHREFSSYQALGGHKASHKNKPAAPKDRRATAASTTSQSTSTIINSTRTRRCSVCLKTFASGQALGGHKRRHFEGGSGGSALTDDMEWDHVHRGNIDLNLPASPKHHSREASSNDFGIESQLLAGDNEPKD